MTAYERMTTHLSRNFMKEDAEDEIELLMKTKPFEKVEEYYTLPIEDACEHHWIELTGANTVCGDIFFGCLCCGYRERWHAED